MIHLLTVGGIVASLLGTPTFIQETAPDEQVVVEVITVNGSGCPAGTTAVAVSDDNMAFTVTYSDYLAQVGVGASPTDFRKNCQLSIDVHVPSGFTYAIAEVDYRGFAHLEEGATASQRANYYFQGTAATAYASHRFAGPYSEDWQVTDTADMVSMAYAPCGESRNLNINTELRVYGGSSDTASTTSFITMDSTDTDLTTVYHFSWMQCPTS